MKRKEDKKRSYDFINHLFCLHKKKMFCIFICLILMSVLSFLQPLIIKGITDNGMMAKNMENILKFSFFLVLVGLLYQVFDLLQVKLFAEVHNGISSSLYQQAYWKMDRMSIKYYSENSSAEVLQMLNSDIGNIASVADHLMTVSITSTLQAFGGIIGLFLLEWRMTILIILLIPAKLLLVYYFSVKKNYAFAEMIRNNRSFCAWLGDCIEGIREMKLWNLFYVRCVEFEKIQRSSMDSYKKNRVLDKYKMMSISLMDILLSAVIYVLSSFMIVKGNFTIGSAFAFVTYSAYVANPISFLLDIKYYFAQIEPSINRFLEFLDLPEEKLEANMQQNIKRQHSVIEKAPILEVEKIVFGYEEKLPILNDLTLTVQPGEKIAIIGENGSGKSTLLDLLLGFYQPESGMIKLHGVPVATLGIETVRKKISVVCQNSYFFKGTIEENVNPDRKATLERVMWACENSGAMDFISKFENGLQQFTGQDGEKLSGGEKQKLAVARALTKEADIFILDEPTSEFDIESNKEVINFICKYFTQKTIILVTHRYEELECIEKVYRLSQGKLKLIKN